MRRFFSLIFVSVIFLISANTHKSLAIGKYDSEADMMFMEGYYEEAIPLYLDLLKKDPKNNTFTFRIGVCYLFTQQEEESLRYLRKVEPLEDPEEELHRHFYLGRALHLNQNFELAIKNYTTYLDSYNSNIAAYNEIVENEVVMPAVYGASFGRVVETMPLKDAIEMLINSCKYGIELSEHPKLAVIENAGSLINTKNAEYAPVINAKGNELFYTTKISLEDGEYAERLFFVVYEDGSWNEPVQIEIESKTEEDIAPLYLSPEEDLLLIYDSKSGNGDIYSVTKQGKFWIKMENLGKPINTKYWEPSASLFPDQKTIIFSSNRPGGFGGLDLYMSTKDEKDKWTEPVNLGPEINTPLDDDAPFILQDGITMYYSSRGMLGVGGYDVFKTTLENGNWTKPENLEMPVNSAHDDIYFTWTGDGRRAYFSSKRRDSKGATDVYYMDFNQISLNVFVNHETSDTLEPIHDFNVSLEHMKTGEMIPELELDNARGLSVFMAKEDDMYMLRIKAPGYIPYVESMSLRRGSELVAYQNKIITLNPRQLASGSKNNNSGSVGGAPKDEIVRVNTPIKNIPKTSAKLTYGGKTYSQGDVLKNKVHFILNVSRDITDYSKNQMDQVIAMMEENPKVKIQIIAHADKSGNSEYNKKLSRERALTVKEYFVFNGIDESRLLGSWKGDEDPIIKTNDPELRNRRVEFVLADL
jgi:outer membrane protein OmpA-like peptidoglycan-associated protein/tetratricopeptide (TPR) repeat protein